MAWTKANADYNGLEYDCMHTTCPFYPLVTQAKINADATFVLVIVGVLLIALGILGVAGIYERIAKFEHFPRPLSF